MSGCPHPATAGGSRCVAHERERQAVRNASPKRAKYKGDWPAFSRAQRKAQPYCHICAAVDDLTVGHDTWQTECRSCNSRKGAHNK